MGSNSNPKMDFVRLNDEIRKKAAELLGDINEDNLKLFAESTKSTAQSIFENYFFEVDDFYTKGLFKIKDEELFDNFIDFKNGYRSKMKKWVSENEIVIQKMTVSPTLEYPILKKIEMKTPAIVAGVGTLIAFGLFIFTDLWIAVAAELLAIGTVIYIYKKQKISNEAEYEFNINMFNSQLEQEKAKLVDGLIKDLTMWLEKAQEYSVNILKAFGI